MPATGAARRVWFSTAEPEWPARCLAKKRTGEWCLSYQYPALRSLGGSQGDWSTSARGHLQMTVSLYALDFIQLAMAPVLRSKG
jgi:hypothetical protein